MAKNNIYVNIDLNRQELQNASVEKLASHPTGPDLFEGRMWVLTTDNKLYRYANSTIVKMVEFSDLNKFGTFVGGLDASSGLPLTGSGVDSEGVILPGTDSIQAGDYWIVTTPGTIVGIEGDDELASGDLLICLEDGATTADKFVGVNKNINEDGIGTIRPASLTTALSASVPVSFNSVVTAANLTNVRSVAVYLDSTGEDITSGLRVDYTAREIESNFAIASVTVIILGD